MSFNPFAIADTCLLIDWAYWRRRDVLFKLFNTVFIPEAVLREVRSEQTIEWVATSLAEGYLALITETSDVIELATRLVERTRLIPGLRGVDMPEAICLAIGKLRGYVVLTENRGALMAVDLLEELSSVTVWRSLEIIREVIKRGLINEEPEKIFKEYEVDTKHRFPRTDLEVVLHELKG